MQIIVKVKSYIIIVETPLTKVTGILLKHVLLLLVLHLQEIG